MDKLLQYKKYLEFTGKATRSEYWGVYLASWLLIIVAMFFFFLLSLSGPFGILVGALTLLGSGFVLTWLVVATAVRRCRDAGINPWFTVSLIIPYINFIVFIVFGVLNTDKENGSTN
jgi:uncharacterized membrane protein YhaH (DUF805 family)